MAGEPTLNSGDTGEWVTYLQQLLEHLGLGSGFVAGVFDEITAAAVRLAQQQHAIGTTGCCDEATWAALTATAHGGQAATDDQTPGDIAISMQDEVAAPDDVVSLTELEELPSHAQAGS
ncbi:MAG TPA: peptidoglycan-binding domain-containing protein [Pseudonocardiaceae bacterium]